MKSEYGLIRRGRKTWTITHRELGFYGKLLLSEEHPGVCWIRRKNFPNKMFYSPQGALRHLGLPLDTPLVIMKNPKGKDG